MPPDADGGSPVFLLSPASLHGRRGARLLAQEARGVWAERLAHGAPIGELFAAVSSLYFRGKLAYALHFGGPRRTRVIAPGVGLVAPSWRIDLERARRMAEVRVSPAEVRYRLPLERAIRRQLRRHDGPFVFLGSLATDRYLAVIGPLLGERLLTPAALYGMGNMQRGSVLLRAAQAGVEMEYVPASKGGRLVRSRGADAAGPGGVRSVQIPERGARAGAGSRGGSAS